MQRMRLFQADARTRSERNKEIYALYEIWYTVVDVLAALSFVVGSVLFLWDSTKTTATWLFIAGSVFFLLKPVIRLVREAKYLAEGDLSDLAKREGWKADSE